MIYQKTVLTSNGLELNAKMQAGGTGLALKYLAVGAGTTELTDKSTALTDQRQTFTFDKVEVDTADTKVIVATVTMNNKDLKVGYDIREMGIYATDPDVGDIMYAVINTEEGADYDHFDAYTENAYEEIIMRIKIKTENADKVSFEFAPESMERKLEAYKVENQKALDNISKRIDTKANKTDLTTPFNFKGSSLSTALPSSGNEVNDTYYCTDLQYRMTWNGTEWYQSSLDEAAYEDELSGLKDDLVDYIGNILSDFKSIPTTLNGVTFTPTKVNGQRAVALSGTSTEGIFYSVSNSLIDVSMYPVGTKFFIGGAYNGNIRVVVETLTSDNTHIEYYQDNGNNLEFSLGANEAKFKLMIIINPNVNCNNVTIVPRYLLRDSLYIKELETNKRIDSILLNIGIDTIFDIENVTDNDGITYNRGILNNRVFYSMSGTSTGSLCNITKDFISTDKYNVGDTIVIPYSGTTDYRLAIQYFNSSKTSLGYAQNSIGDAFLTITNDIKYIRPMIIVNKGITVSEAIIYPSFSLKNSIEDRIYNIEKVVKNGKISYNTNNRNSFIGAYNYVIQKLLESRPKAKIAIVTHYTPDYTKKNELADMVKAQKYLAKYWRIPLIDLSNSGFGINNYYNTLNAKVGDSIHIATDYANGKSKNAEDIGKIVAEQLKSAFGDITGKKVAWFGTSIPAGFPHTDIDTCKYPNIACNILGATIYNYSKPASCIRMTKYDGTPVPTLSSGAERDCFSNDTDSYNANNTGDFAHDSVSGKITAKTYIMDKLGTDFEPDIYVFDHGFNDWYCDITDVNNMDYTTV